MTTYPFDINSLVKICRENDVTTVCLFGSMAERLNSRTIPIGVT
jgi:DUF1009 family protein